MGLNRRQIKEMAEEILQEYTNCYSEADEVCLERMLSKLVSETIRDIKTQVYNKAVYPDGTREHGYITLKAFDSVIDEMLRR